MKIHTSEEYYHAWDDPNCPFGDECKRFYCAEHRCLYKSCETKGYYGEYTNDCPECIDDFRRSIARQKQRQWEILNATRN